MKPFDFSTKKCLTLLIIAIVSSVGIYGLYLIKNSQQISLIYGVNHQNTRCQINEYVVLANQFQLQIDYQKFGSIQLTGLRKNLDQFNDYIYKIEKNLQQTPSASFPMCVIMSPTLTKNLPPISQSMPIMLATTPHKIKQCIVITMKLQNTKNPRNHARRVIFWRWRMACWGIMISRI